MIKNTNKKKHTVRKVLLIVAGVIFIPIILFFIVIFISNLFDQHKFSVLDNQMQVVLGELKSVTGTDQWNYKKECGAIYSGWAKSGGYSCSVVLSTEKLTSNPKDVSDQHQRYSVVLDRSDTLRSKANIVSTPYNFLGNKLMIGGLDKQYTEKASGIECYYIIKIEQSDYDQNLDESSQEYPGAKVNKDIGKLITKFECGQKTSKSWYPLNKDTRYSF